VRRLWIILLLVSALAVPAAASARVRLVSTTSPINHGAYATLTVAVSPIQTCSITVLGGILSVKGSATTDGKFVLAVGAAVILSRILKRGAVPLVIGGITAGAVAIYDIANIQSKIDADAREFGAAVGWGLSAVLVGAVVLLVAAATNERKSLR
jgi:hypothetical protein